MDLSTTIFGKMIDGEIPCHRLYEDEQVLAFLDIGPLSRGHTLVIPKERAARLHELSDDAAAAVGRVLPRLCRAVMTAVGAESYNLLVNTGESAGQVVMHTHFHIIPKSSDSGFMMGWNAGKLSDDDAKKLIADITAALAE